MHLFVDTNNPAMKGLMSRNGCPKSILVIAMDLLTGSLSENHLTSVG